MNKIDKGFEVIVNMMREQAPSPLNEFEDYLDDLLNRDRITWEESQNLWNLAIELVNYRKD